jgi:hypothetical protein
MAGFVDSVILGQTKIDPHSLSVVKQSIIELKYSLFTTLFLRGQNGQMMMEFVEGMGYYISAFGKGELEEWLACDENLPPEQVSVNLSGEMSDVPRNILVPEETALDVAAPFYQDGSRSSRHCWVRSLDLI